MTITEKLERITLNLLTEESYTVEEIRTGLTDEQFEYLLNL